MDKATWIGLTIGFGCIILGNLIEGGHMGSLMQFTAFVIVTGGTLGAVMVSNSSTHLKMGFRMLRTAFYKEQTNEIRKSAESIVDLARLARKETLLAIAPTLPRVRSDFVRGIAHHLVEGLKPEQIRTIIEAEIETEEELLLASAKIWTDAGGYAPTIGIIGAVLGLIHVMGNLSDTSKLGAGIAVAFVATVYGVSFANLLFLPIGNKLKKKAQNLIRDKLFLLDGALLIGSETSPLVIEQQLLAHLGKHEK
jgi:chemotaxis protein MotA